MKTNLTAAKQCNLEKKTKHHHDTCSDFKHAIRFHDVTTGHQKVTERRKENKTKHARRVFEFSNFSTWPLRGSVRAQSCRCLRLTLNNCWAPGRTRCLMSQEDCRNGSSFVINI